MESIQVARFVILAEFLAQEELTALIEYTLKHESAFKASSIILSGASEGKVNSEHRRSRVFYETGKYQAVISDRIQSSFAWILQKLQHPSFSIVNIEAQITASNDGEYFKLHNDNTAIPIRSREITFVYYFHHEPKAFTGGELRIYDSGFQNGRYIATDNFKTIVPQQNQIVFFPSFLIHEVLPVQCPTRAFIDSRFTLNGWIRK